MSAKITSALSDKLVPILLFASIALAFVVGVLWQRVANLEGGNTTKATDTQQATTQTDNQAAAAQPKLSLDTVKSLFDKDLIKFGDKNKKLIFIEASDASCPYCSISTGLNPELNKSAGARFTLVSDGGTYVAPVAEMEKLVRSGKASYVYIYFPGHGNGEMGARSLYCAQEKNKFWEVHDKLMTAEGYDLLNNTVKNDKTKAKDLAQFLSPAFNASEMQSCLESSKYDERLKTDMQIAQSLGAQGTPFFAVNETAFPGAYSYKDMESAVEAALK